MFFSVGADSKAKPQNNEHKLTKDLSLKVNSVPPDENIKVIITFKKSKGGLRASAVRSSLKDDIKAKGGKVKREYKVIEGMAIELPASEVAALANNPDVLTIEYDHPVKAHINESVPLINADDVWNKTRLGRNITGIGQTVCVIDSGVNYTNSFFGGAMDPAYTVIGGYDFVNNDSYPMDDYGHGTHVSGIVASVNSTYRGVAPGAKIVALKVLDDEGIGSFIDINSAIDWCIDNASLYNISVISMSLGTYLLHYGDYCDSTYPSTAAFINSAIANNISVVVSTGNEYNYAAISSPACIQNATRVTATDKSDNFASFANRGGVFDILAAPGVSIWSRNYTDHNDLTALSGTSQAAPHVSGLIALLNQEYKLIHGTNPTPSYLFYVMNSTGVQIYDVNTSKNYSRINALAAHNVISFSEVYSNDLDDDGNYEDHNFTASYNASSNAPIWTGSNNTLDITDTNSGTGNLIIINGTGLRYDGNSDGDLDDDIYDYTLYSGIYVVNGSAGEIQFAYNLSEDGTYGSGDRNLDTGDVVSIRGSKYVLTDGDTSDMDIGLNGPAIAKQLPQVALDPDNATVFTGTLKMLYDGSSLYMYDGNILVDGSVSLSGKTFPYKLGPTEKQSDEYAPYDVYVINATASMAKVAMVNTSKQITITSDKGPHISMTYSSNDLHDDIDALDEFNQTTLTAVNDAKLYDLNGSDADYNNYLRYDGNADGDLKDDPEDYTFYSHYYVVDAGSGYIQLAYRPVLDSTYSISTDTHIEDLEDTNVGAVVKVKGVRYVITDSDTSDLDIELGPAIVKKLSNTTKDPDNGVVVTGTLKMLWAEDKLVMYDGNSLLDEPNVDGKVYHKLTADEKQSDEFAPYDVYVINATAGVEAKIAMVEKSQKFKVTNDEEGVFGYSQVKIEDTDWNTTNVTFLSDIISMVKGSRVDVPDTYYELKFTASNEFDILRKGATTSVLNGSLLTSGQEYLDSTIRVSKVGQNVSIEYGSGLENVTSIADGTSLTDTALPGSQFLASGIGNVTFTILNGTSEHTLNYSNVKVNSNSFPMVGEIVFLSEQVNLTEGSYTNVPGSYHSVYLDSSNNIDIFRRNDTTPPSITSGPTASVSSSSATIIWTTDEAADSKVEYGANTSYGTSVNDTSLVTSHSLTLSGLSSSTTYHYRVVTADNLGNINTSEDYNFTTSAPAPPTSGGGGGSIPKNVTINATVEDGNVTGTFSKISSGTIGTMVIPDEADVSFEELAIAVKATVINAEIVIYKLSEKPGTISEDISGETQSYIQLDETNIEAADIDTVTIKFKVPVSWIEDNRIDEEKVVLNRYADDKWNALETTREGEDDIYVHYSAVSPGLSVFAISGHVVTVKPAAFIPMTTTPPTTTLPPATTPPTTEPPAGPKSPVTVLAVLLLVIIAGTAHYLYHRKGEEGSRE